MADTAPTGSNLDKVQAKNTTEPAVVSTPVKPSEGDPEGAGGSAEPKTDALSLDRNGNGDLKKFLPNGKLNYVTHSALTLLLAMIIKNVVVLFLAKF